MATLTPPLKWHGGKHYLAKKIIELMPPHKHYVEPYFGGGAVLLEKDPEGVSEVANDINGELTNFWATLADRAGFQEFKRTVEAVPFSESVWKNASESEPPPGWNATVDPMHRAVAFFIRCRQSRAGKFRDFATLSRKRTRRGMNEQASAWITAVDGLQDVHERLRRVVILNRDALDVIRQQDGPDTLFYLDPPYLHETRKSKDDYAHEMTQDQHADLLETLSTIDGAFLLSGYPSPTYDYAEGQYGWWHVDFDLPNNAAGGKSKRRMTERVWMNFKPECHRSS